MVVKYLKISNIICREMYKNHVCGSKWQLFLNEKYIFLTG